MSSRRIANLHRSLAARRRTIASLHVELLESRCLLSGFAWHSAGDADGRSPHRDVLECDEPPVSAVAAANAAPTPQRRIDLHALHGIGDLGGEGESSRAGGGFARGGRAAGGRFDRPTSTPRDLGRSTPVDVAAYAPLEPPSVSVIPAAAPIVVTIVTPSISAPTLVRSAPTVAPATSSLAPTSIAAATASFPNSAVSLGAPLAVRPSTTAATVRDDRGEAAPFVDSPTESAALTSATSSSAYEAAATVVFTSFGDDDRVTAWEAPWTSSSSDRSWQTVDDAARRSGSSRDDAEADEGGSIELGGVDRDQGLAAPGSRSVRRAGDAGSHENGWDFDAEDQDARNRRLRAWKAARTARDLDLLAFERAARSFEEPDANAEPARSDAWTATEDGGLIELLANDRRSATSGPRSEVASPTAEPVPNGDAMPLDRAIGMFQEFELAASPSSPAEPDEIAAPKL